LNSQSSSIDSGVPFNNSISSGSGSDDILVKAQSLNNGTSGGAASEISQGAEAAEGGAKGVFEKVAEGAEDL